MTRSTRNQPRAVPLGPLDGLLSALVAALLVARLLIPAEASVLGDTLGLVQLWFAAGILWAWSGFRAGTFTLRAGWIDAALWLLIAGHAASTAWVFTAGGNRRVALNLAWEWIALGVSFFLVRQILRTRSDARRLLMVITAVIVSLAGLGLWQHYVAFPENVARYERLQGLEERSPGSPEVRRELTEMGVPDAASSRALWEERLRSTEPFATMALANTLAGLLAAWLIVAVAALVRGWRPTGRWPARLGGLAAVLLLAYCLVLTKSRTAIVGTAAGLAAWLTLSAVGTARSRRWIGWGVLGLAALGLLVAVAGLSGGFDRQVLSEAPKSLLYRVQYWTASVDLVREHPLFGVGPGNFRQHYLRHKLPESSEEILDPHNFVLDVWASGGLLGLAGLIWFLILAARAMARKCDGVAESPPPARMRNSAQPSASSPLVAGGPAGFGLVLAAGLILGDIDERLIALLAGWFAAVAALSSFFVRGELSPWAPLAGCAALLVHLLGAGGIEMPAVVMSLLVLVAAGTVLAAPDADLIARPRSWTVRAAGLFAAAGFVACLITATVPVFYRHSLIIAGDGILAQGGNVQRAAGLYAEAAERDPLSPEPVERQGELAFHRWSQSPRQLAGEFDRAVQFANEAIRRDPFSANGYRRLGVWYLERFRQAGERDFAVAAAEYLAEAVERYPHSAALRADFARALAAAGDGKTSKQQARIGLRLDELNRREGHRDKYLDPETVETLQQIVGRGAAGQPGG